MRFDRPRVLGRSAASRGLIALSAGLRRILRARRRGSRRRPTSVYRNGFVYTVDAADSVQQALAIRAGRIVYVGSDAGRRALRGAGTPR